MQVLKEEVDCFRPGKRVPHCHLKAKFTGDLANIPDLECHVDVLGAREPHNEFTIDISPMLGVSDPLPPPVVQSSSSMSSHTKRVVPIFLAEGAAIYHTSDTTSMHGNLECILNHRTVQYDIV